MDSISCDEDRVDSVSLQTSVLYIIKLSGNRSWVVKVLDHNNNEYQNTVSK